MTPGKAKQQKELRLGALSGDPLSRGRKKRVGRGHSAGGGKTCGRGHKGQKSRSGGVKRPGFEGGQTPLYRRLPKINRFSNYLFKKRYAVVNLSDISKYKDEIGLEKLISEGFVKEGELVKVLGEGKLSHPLTIHAHAFSESAKKKIESAGGKAIGIKK